MSDEKGPGRERPQEQQPTTEEALPEVRLGPDAETERRAEEILGPETAEERRSE